ncbi:MAG: YraN family protein [Pseudomonadota bacterium]
MTEARRQRGSRAAATGTGAEDIAAGLLLAEGWVVLARRARTPAGEIDLIAERDGLLAFVEVKARPSLVEAAYALGPRQRARLMAGAEAWLAVNPGHGAGGMRFDVILVAADGSARRIRDAFRIGDL